ncbi:MAG: hypothetical protein ACI4EI_05025 [Muricoprocola sp.]
MKNLKKKYGMIAAFIFSFALMCSMTAFAEEYNDGYYEEYYEDDYSSSSGDNSLYSLGLENATECSPEFYYSTLEYDVVVPAGTTALELDPIKSANDAEIVDISGTTLEDGKATVEITVKAANGAVATYTLHVKEDGASEAAATAETEKEKDEAATESEKAVQEALKQQAESEAQAKIQEAVEAKQKQIDTLAAENSDLADRLDLLMKIAYGLIGLAVVLLFFIINQSLRNKDLKDDIKEAKSQVTESYEFARKEQNMQSDFYYAPVQNMQQINPGAGVPMQEVSGNVQAAFGTAPQKLQAQQMMPNMPQQMKPEMPEEKISKREAKKQAKAAKQATREEARQVKVNPPVQESMPYQTQQPQQSFEPTMVQSTVEEPDVDVNMIDL